MTNAGPYRTELKKPAMNTPKKKKKKTIKCVIAAIAVAPHKERRDLK